MRFIHTVLAVLLLCLVAPARAEDRSAGFQHLTTPEGVEVGVWYPSSGEAREIPLGITRQPMAPGAPVEGSGLPLVVMSHGNGGSFASHADTAVALAKAGFVVAALTHPGDNWKDQSKATDMAARPQALSRLIDFMLDTWSDHAAIDPDRIAAFGFSSGGFTVLAAAGGIPDFSRMRDHCMAHPAYYDCKLIAARAHPANMAWPVQADPRIKALVVAAPALGFTFADGGLDALNLPVQLWRAENDHILPAPDYALAVRGALPAAPEFHAVPKADHFDFLAPCNGPVVIPAICTSAPDFDRAAFHRQFNAEVIRFLTGTLPTE